MAVKYSDSIRLGNLLAALAVAVVDGLDDAFVDEGIDAKAGTALVALLDFAPAATEQRLCLAIGLTHSGTVRLVDRLRVAKLVERARGGDGRTVAVRLTAAGRKVALRLRHARRDLTSSLLSGLTDRQRTELMPACERLIAALTARRLAMREAGDSPSGGALCRLCDFRACGRPDGMCPSAAARNARRSREGGKSGSWNASDRA